MHKRISRQPPGKRARCRSPLGCLVLVAAHGASGADVWEGSVALTNDYLVRGISRSDHDPAVQLDWHYLADSGLIAGAFASNARLDPQQSWTAELSPYLGLAWSARDDWRGKLLAAYYGYPPTAASGPSYDYAEVDLDVNYRQWLGVSFAYSPAAPRFSRYAGLTRAQSWAAEIDLQQPLLNRLAGTAGVGHERFAGAQAAGYLYWSVGLTYDLAPLSLSLAYADTDAAARALFFGNAARGRWIATAIRRF